MCYVEIESIFLLANKKYSQFILCHPFVNILQSLIFIERMTFFDRKCHAYLQRAKVMCE